MTEAIIEYQTLPSGIDIQWISVELTNELTGDMVSVVGIVTIVDAVGNKSNSRLYGIIPLDVVLRFDKQSIFEYFDMQRKLKEFEKYEQLETDELH